MYTVTDRKLLVRGKTAYQLLLGIRAAGQLQRSKTCVRWWIFGRRRRTHNPASAVSKGIPIFRCHVNWKYVAREKLRQPIAGIAHSGAIVPALNREGFVGIPVARRAVPVYFLPPNSSTYELGIVSCTRRFAPRLASARHARSSNRTKREPDRGLRFCPTYDLQMPRDPRSKNINRTSHPRMSCINRAKEKIRRHDYSQY